MKVRPSFPKNEFNNRRKNNKWLSYTGLLLLASSPLLHSSSVQAAEGDDTRPNIVLLVADDAGFSDFSRFGGEASTPVMDTLSQTGMTLTNFHVLPTCSPSRATFLTGVDNHLNGLGSMQGTINSLPNNAQVGTPGYSGYLNKRVVTTATLLKDSGYNTLMTGKWHLGLEEDPEGGQTLFPRGWWPIDRGFDKSYGVLEGGGEHYGSCERAEGHCTRFFENDAIITNEIPADYFSAKYNMDKGIEFIKEGKEESAGQRKPFFFYFADTMVHEPNQVPDEYIKQEYIDKYLSEGWDGIRQERLEKMKDLGIIPASLALPMRNPSVPDWHDETDPLWEPLMERVTTPPYNVMWEVDTVADLKKTLAKKMAVYTGMVEYFDYQVSRLVTHLKDEGEYDNTVFIYFSDNGGDGRDWDEIDKDYMYRRGVNNTYENIGKRNSFVSNGPGWAQVANTPLYGSKITMAQGGIRSPLVITYPKSDIQSGGVSGTITTLKDIAATVLSYAKVDHPVGSGVKPSWESCTGTYGDQTGVCPMNGKDLSGLLEGKVSQVHQDEPLGFELFAFNPQPDRALFLEESDGNLWKILRLRTQGFTTGPGAPWALFNLTVDPSESTDLGGQYPDRLKNMIAMFDDYEKDVSIIKNNSQTTKDVVPGTDVTYTFNITNDGTEQETFAIDCHSSWTCERSAETESSVTLASGESAEASIIVSVPATAETNEINNAQVRLSRTNNPQLSTNLTFVTVSGEQLPPTPTAQGGGSMPLNYFFMMFLGLISLRLLKPKK